MTLPVVTGEFRIVADPELRFAQSGTAVGSARIVANSRKQDPDTKEWKDDKECWLNLTVFNKMAENLAESFQKGDLIVVSGRLETRNYETREGEKRTSFDVVADTVGMSTRWNAAKSVRAERASGESGGAPAAAAAPAADPWATPPQGDQPPF